MNNKIDFVITWVDGNDPEWQKERAQFSNFSGDNRSVRFRDWDNLQYLFRGIEKFTPWVNKVYFVTWGHTPSWLNENNPKLKIVKHTEFIPQRYLPTFNSHTIELNLHRIQGLSDRFVYFNDDTFITGHMKETDFFKKGLPCDSGVLSPVIGNFRGSISSIIINNMEIINSNFTKNEVLKNNLGKWFNPLYKKDNINTFLLLPWKKFVGFKNPHLPVSYLKETFNHLWEQEHELLDDTCEFKFRNKQNINHWLMRYWQLVNGTFTPRDTNIGYCYSLTNKNEKVFNAIKNQKYKLTCVNDNDSDPISNFNLEKDLLKKAFHNILPEKSSFEM
ncbi:stealth family protein [Evansella clarkii]|uniref:stealth family protein n=1 Tax=Evansella clarkii TaxID=79879 RepID=UPI000996632E|nr:stealth family protein [Evansella clarkii]